MWRFLRDFLIYGFAYFILRTVLGVEVEEYWNGTLQPFLEANAWGWVATMSSFLTTFSGGVVVALVVVTAVRMSIWWYLKRREKNASSRQIARTNDLVHGVAPDGITFQLFPLHDGVDVSMIVTIMNPTKAIAHVKIFGWDCEIGGQKPLNRTGVGISSPLLPGQKQQIRLARVRISRIGSNISGWAQLAIAFGDDRTSPNTVAKFRYEFGFDDYGPLVPGETQVSDYLNYQLSELEYQPSAEFKKDEVTSLRSQ